MPKSRPYVVALLVAASAMFVAVPSRLFAQSSVTVTDVRKNCQIAVPAGWTVEMSTAYSPGKTISATVNGAVARGSFADGKALVQTAMKPVKVLSDTPKLFLYTFDPGSLAAGKTGWYAVAATTPTCATSLMFPAGTNEATLRAVVDSLAPVKK
jgi:hypothetical protein